MECGRRGVGGGCGWVRGFGGGGVVKCGGGKWVER